MAKVSIKSEKLSPFGGVFSIMEQFDSNLSSVIDSTLGMRCRLYGYQLLLSGKPPKSIKSLPNIYIYGHEGKTRLMSIYILGGWVQSRRTHLIFVETKTCDIY